MRGGTLRASPETTFDWAGGRVGAGRPNARGAGAAGPAGGKGEVIVGRGYAAQANIMVSDQTVKNLAETFERTKATLPTG